jgi:hypothetical protein
MNDDDKKSILSLSVKLASYIEENQTLQKKVVGLVNIRNEQQTGLDIMKARC